MMRRSSIERRERRGAATVELAVCLPFLILIFLGAVDYCRVFYGVLTTSNCARNEGYEAYDMDYTTGLLQSGYVSPYKGTSAQDSLSKAAHADYDPNTSFGLNNGGLNPKTVTTDGNPNTTLVAQYATIDCGYSFNCITKFPGLPIATNLDRTLIVRIAPLLPKF